MKGKEFMSIEKYILDLSPLWVKEKFYWRSSLPSLAMEEVRFKDVPLLFAKGVKLDLLNTCTAHKPIVQMGFFELALTRKLSELAKAGGLLLDVGANFGYFSCMWASLNPSNKVIAFEASPRVFKPLSINVAKNGLQDRVTIVNKALGNEKGILPFDPGPDSETGWGGLVSQSSQRTIDVPVVTLDEYMDPEVKIAAMKIDTEGADYLVLLGATSILKQKKVAHIFYEENLSRMKALGIKKDEAKSFLESIGYKVRNIRRDEYHAFLD
jgi:FkbM family methyltransferase